ncbi:MAG: M28 family peptidase [Terriglobales bacterium]
MTMRFVFPPRATIFSMVVSLLVTSSILAQSPEVAAVKRAAPGRYGKPAQTVCAACIRAHEEFLASDAMQGRGSGTHDELVAATYVAAELRAYGIAPAGDNGGYIQSAPLIKSKLTAPPTLEIIIKTADGAAPITWTYGKEFRVSHLTRTEFSGPLRKLDAADATNPRMKIDRGAVVLVTGDPKKVRSASSAAASAGAIACLSASDQSGRDLEAKAKNLPRLADRLEGDSSDMGDFDFLELSADAARTLAQAPDGSQIHFRTVSEQEKGLTWNAVGILQGTDPKLQHEAVLLSAHLDHLGIGKPVNGDNIYNGADDDASGTTAVLELARVLGAGPRPLRTVIFALFGSEETGGLGSTYFREHPPLPLKEIAANLEFEMIGRPDPKVKADSLWLTGWERSNLGPTLAAHGANLVGDPHPEQNFFARSDNYVLAKKGVVAQTVSSYGMHADYHRPSDDIEHLDFDHMDAAIGSMLGPVEWLVNSDFTPTWNPGGKP